METTNEQRVYIGRQGGLQLHKFDSATDADLLRVAPAIFGATDSNRVKATYQHCSTAVLVQAMRAEGWQVTAAGQKYTRDAARYETTRHFVRLRHVNADGNAELVPEGILVNSHDGTTAWKFYTGAFRFACANGLIFGQMVQAVHVHHTLRGAGQAGALAMQASMALYRALPEKLQLVDRLKDIELTEAQQLDYYQRALLVRWAPGYAAPVTTAELMAAPRLAADVGASAWLTYNHAQRWLVEQGSIPGHTATGRNTTSRGVTRVTEMVRVNVGLWDAMLEVAGVKAAGATVQVAVPAVVPVVVAPTVEPVAKAPKRKTAAPKVAKPKAAKAKSATKKATPAKRK